jgi:hypothetical protein
MDPTKRKPLIIALALLLSSCANFGSRGHFRVPEPLPLLQVIVPLDGSFEIKRSPHGTPHDGKLMIGLIVPITEDGYCLTAAHNLGKGRAMSTFETQIGRRQFGNCYTLVEAKENGGPAFLRLQRGINWIVTAGKRGDPSSNRFVTSSGGSRRVIMMLPELEPHQFEALKNKPVHRDAVLCVRARVIKIWPDEDLALVKVPFLTPSHLTFCGNPTADAEPLMMMLNPGMHQGTINPVARKVPLPKDLDLPLKFSNFNPLILDGLRIIEEGDSGGPVINREGELVGLILASGNASNGRSVDLAVGIQKRPILDAIEKSRKTASAFSRVGMK